MTIFLCIDAVLYLQCLFSAHTFSYHYFISRPIFSLPFLIVLHPSRKNVSSHSFHYEFSLRPASRSLKGLLSLPGFLALFSTFFGLFFFPLLIIKRRGQHGQDFGSRESIPCSAPKRRKMLLLFVRYHFGLAVFSWPLLCNEVAF